MWGKKSRFRKKIEGLWRRRIAEAEQKRHWEAGVKEGQRRVLSRAWGDMISTLWMRGKKGQSSDQLLLRGACPKGRVSLGKRPEMARVRLEPQLGDTHLSKILRPCSQDEGAAGGRVLTEYVLETHLNTGETVL